MAKLAALSVVVGSVLFGLVGCDASGTLPQGTSGGPTGSNTLTPPTAVPPTACPAGSALVNNVCAPAAAATPVTPVTPVVPAACGFDTHTVLNFNGKIVESITTKRGTLFNFEADGTAWPSNGMDLTTVSYFAAGPCAGRGPGQCHFDTRTFAFFAPNHLIEFVTAYGRSWAWENGNPTDNGSDLATTPRYAGICARRGNPGEKCVFDSRTFVQVNGELMEAITAYGKYFAFDAHGQPSRDNGLDLALVPRYAAGPCKGQVGMCVFDTRTYGLENNRTVEIVTAGGFVWRYEASEQAAFAEIQPSGVPMLNVPTWAGPCQ